MASLNRMLVAVLACSSLISASLTRPSLAWKRDIFTSTSNSSCTTKTQRKAWHKMTNPEKQAYIDAELCLINTPGDLGLPGAQTKFGELQYAHVWQSNVIHYSGQFLPWHRYFIYTHEQQLKNVCNYTGGQPYWEEELDTKNASLQMADSPIFDTVYGFGGNGAGESQSWCVQDGPFANMTNHLGPYYEISDTCLSRQFEPVSFSLGNQTYIDECMSYDNYYEAFWCWKSNPHSNAHLGVNGTILDTVASPGDPLFYLHHTNLDRLWWEWQAVNLTSRLYDMGGGNTPPVWWLDKNNMAHITAAQVEGFNDPTNSTSLQHNLIVEGILPNTTVESVMDIRNDLLCYEYVY